SSSAPIVAGFLALARQKWPDATANQLLQLLVHTTVNTDGGWNQYTGYGLASPATMINTDPSQYPDENPLADKGGATSPTPEEVRQYADGIVDPSEIIYDNSYTYRGLNETTLTSTNNPYPTHIGTSPRYHTK
ncbi:S8 family serine peptidase, partial [Kytococcus sedentarius]